MTNHNQFHATNQQNQVGNQNEQSFSVEAGGGEKSRRQTQRFLAAAMEALPAPPDSRNQETDDLEGARPIQNSRIFHPSGPVSAYLEQETVATEDFWEQLLPVRGAIKKAFAALGKSAIEHWIKQNPRVQPLLDFARVLIDELA